MLHRVATRWILKTGSMETMFDAVIRARILELVAGVTKNTWTRNPKYGLPAAAKYFRENYEVELDDSWLETNSQNLYKAMWHKARSITGNDIDAEDVIQNVIGEISTKTGAFHYLAGRFGDTVRETGKGLGAFRSHLINHVRQKAIDVKRLSTREDAYRQRVAPIKTNVTPGQVTEGVPHDVTSLRMDDSGTSLHMTLTRSPNGRKFWNRLLDKLKTKFRQPHYVEIFQKRIELGKRGISNKQLAQEYNISGTAVGAILRKVGVAATEIVEKDPVLRAFADKLPIGETLGLGGSHTRLSSERVATKFLSQ